MIISGPRPSNIVNAEIAVAAGIVDSKLVIGSQAGEGHIVLLPPSSTVIQGTWVWNAYASQLAGFAYNNITWALDDEIDFLLWLAAGTYTFQLFGCTDGNSGIAEVSLNAAVIGSLDFYSAAMTYNVKKTIAGAAVATSGLYTLKLRMHTKNGAALHYWLALSFVEAWRTA